MLYVCACMHVCMYYTSELHGAMGLFFSYAGPVMMEHPGGVYVHVYTCTVFPWMPGCLIFQGALYMYVYLAFKWKIQALHLYRN